MPPVPRILIVDDDPIIPHLVTSMLQQKGYAIAGIVTTGEEAVVKAAELTPDLVIMDVNLPGQMDGTEAANYIFQLFRFPILFITGVSEEERLERVKCSRPYGIVFKPFTGIAISTSVALALYNHANRTGDPDRFPAGEPKKLNGMLEAVFVTDRQGRIIYYNPYAAWFADVPPDRILMKHWRDVLMFTSDQTGEELKDPVEEAIRSQAGTILDPAAAVTTTGKGRKVRIAVRPLQDDHDRFLAVLVSIKEKTPRP